MCTIESSSISSRVADFSLDDYLPIHIRGDESADDEGDDSAGAVPAEEIKRDEESTDDDGDDAAGTVEAAEIKREEDDTAGTEEAGRI